MLHLTGSDLIYNKLEFLEIIFFTFCGPRFVLLGKYGVAIATAQVTAECQKQCDPVQLAWQSKGLRLKKILYLLDTLNAVMRIYEVKKLPGLCPASILLSNLRRNPCRRCR
jgi:hypothetical protein